MKIKLWLKYLCYIVLIFAILFVEANITRKLSYVMSRTWDGKYGLYIVLVRMAFNVLLGLLLGIETLLKEVKREGKWNINLPKLILMGIPLFYFSFSYLFGYINIPFVQNVIAYPAFKLVLFENNLITILQLILGYVIITSLYKEEKRKVYDV
ncbi:hypothetical protein I5677_02355 [Mobilitalea sibirica]|uniref:Uncharacterized protein n=1 Tax=Mobilitalea sibirica TaxID=1462919 RepID=A0A8J7H148_9FIRM|nr:hypothetical protein [Mobilitalea sibirica]MBH1939735.1 hypothetical protein [Mobilitalea sibirica]